MWMTVLYFIADNKKHEVFVVLDGANLKSVVGYDNPEDYEYYDELLESLDEYYVYQAKRLLHGDKYYIERMKTSGVKEYFDIGGV